jgi:hypothetical protein
MHSSLIAAAVAALTIGVSSATTAQSPDTTKKPTPTKSSKDTAKAAAKKPAASTQRIKVKKETAAGDVVPIRPADTTVVTDTSARVVDTTKVDTTVRIDTMSRPDTTTAKVDTTAKVTPASTIDATTLGTAPGPIMRRRHFGNFYAGLASGTSVPSGDIYNGYNPGLNISVPMGWQPQGSLFGVRLDVAYDRLSARSTFRNNGQPATLVTLNNGTYTTSGTSTYTAPSSGTPTSTGSTGSTAGSGYYNGLATVANSDATLASAMLDAKMKLPVFGSQSPASFYAIAGGGLHYFLNYSKSLALTNPAAEQEKFAALHQAIDAAAASGAPYSSASYSSTGYSAVTRPGLNAGAGFQWSMGARDLFIESRYVNIFTKDRSTTYWPIVLGVTWR